MKLFTRVAYVCLAALLASGCAYRSDSSTDRIPRPLTDEQYASILDGRATQNVVVVDVIVSRHCACSVSYGVLRRLEYKMERMLSFNVTPLMAAKEIAALYNAALRPDESIVLISFHGLSPASHPQRECEKFGDEIKTSLANHGLRGEVVPALFLSVPYLLMNHLGPPR